LSKILLSELQYLPPISFWKAVATHETVCLEQCEHYVKGSNRNKCAIASSNGLLRLSIPLQQGKNQQQNIKEVRIANDIAWQRQHWRSLSSAYGSAPFWAHYEGHLQPFYDKKYDLLWDFNHDLFVKIHQLLKLKTNITASETYQKDVIDTEITDIRQQRHAVVSDNILHTTPPLPYPQVFADKHGFLPNLSVIDALFCLGNRVLDF
jgi:WbqC-like protein family